MAQFSVKIIRLNGAVLDENQQSQAKKRVKHALSKKMRPQMRLQTVKKTLRLAIPRPWT